MVFGVPFASHRLGWNHENRDFAAVVKLVEWVSRLYVTASFSGFLISPVSPICPILKQASFPLMSPPCLGGGLAIAAPSLHFISACRLTAFSPPLMLLPPTPLSSLIIDSFQTSRRQLHRLMLDTQPSPATPTPIRRPELISAMSLFQTPFQDPNAVLISFRGGAAGSISSEMGGWNGYAFMQRLAAPML